MVELVYPTGIDFDEAIDVGKRIIEKYGGSIPANRLTKEFNLAPSATYSGAFYRKVKALRRFGILKQEKAKGEYAVTNLMKKAADESDQEEAIRAKRKMWESVPLIKKLNEEFGRKRPKKDEFTAGLYKITKADWSKVKKKSNTIRNLYTRSLDYFETAEKEKKEGMEEEEVPAEAPSEDLLRREIKVPEMPEPLEGEVDISEYRVGDTYLRVPLRKGAIERVKKVLELWEEELK